MYASPKEAEGLRQLGQDTGWCDENKDINPSGVSRLQVSYIIFILGLAAQDGGYPQRRHGVITGTNEPAAGCKMPRGRLDRPPRRS